VNAQDPIGAQLHVDLARPAGVGRAVTRAAVHGLSLVTETFAHVPDHPSATAIVGGASRSILSIRAMVGFGAARDDK
jgi:hypothetical protein